MHENLAEGALNSCSIKKPVLEILKKYRKTSEKVTCFY